MAKTTKGTGDFAVCKEAADQFLAIAQKSKGETCMDYLMTGFYPYAVNVAFACELYLKAIMIIRSQSDEFDTGHNLKKLFNGLEIIDATYIENEFQTQFSAKTLSEFLTDNGDVFINWRYALEKAVAIDVTGFDVFADILKKYVHALASSN